AGAGGSGGVEGSVSVWTLNTNTLAVIDNHARVVAQGNIFLAADGNIAVTQEAGGIGLGQYVGFGLSSTTLVKIDVVKARLGEGAAVIGLGNRGTVDVPTGERDDDGDNETAPLRGVAVSATSLDKVSSRAVTAAVAQNAALAGSGQVAVLLETTRATIDDG